LAGVPMKAEDADSFVQELLAPYPTSKKDI